MIHCMSLASVYDVIMMQHSQVLSLSDCHEDPEHRCCEDIRNGIPVDMLLEEMKKYCV